MGLLGNTALGCSINAYFATAILCAALLLQLRSREELFVRRDSVRREYVLADTLPRCARIRCVHDHEIGAVVIVPRDKRYR